jgi:hypothetical protein
LDTTTLCICAVSCRDRERKKTVVVEASLSFSLYRLPFYLSIVRVMAAWTKLKKDAAAMENQSFFQIELIKMFEN